MTEKKDRYGRGTEGADTDRRGGAGMHSAKDSGENATPAPGSASSGSSSPSGGGASLLPAVSLPKGGGALHGVGEKFTTNAATGTGALSVPIATSPGRGGSGLALQLSYDSGAGNGPFGLGWRLSVPSITRKTDKGLPRYLDSEESDLFILAGAEDLVPVRVPDGASTRLDVVDRGDYRVQRFRPRVEGLFARIERWTHHLTRDTHWRAITRDNLLSIYGQTAQARISDPDHPERVFSWLLEETRDDRGNVVCYRYKPEDAAGVDPGIASEANRFVRQPDGTRRFVATAQRYLKRIQYGNRTPVARDQPAPANDTDWLFEVVLDYGEHDAAAPTPAEASPWTVRPDPFSGYRSSFEVRTYRLCRRVLMFHRFAELGTTPCLVRSTDFAYTDARVRSPDGAFDSGAVASYLASVTQAGYVKTATSYERATLPPLELGYTEPTVHDELQLLPRDRTTGVPDGPRGAGAQWVDLDGEGIPGALTASGRGWYYRANAGSGELAPPALQRSLPAAVELGAGARLTDLDGDGNLDLVSYAPSLAGYFARTPEHDWAPFAPLGALPAIDWNDPNLRFLDLDGDGVPDVLITENNAFVWYRSRAKDGFDPAVRVRHSHEELEGPALVFADPLEAVQLADMTGDGLMDLVRVRNGEVCYWPNLGYGRFGRKVTLDHSPRFDAADRFTAMRIRFADVDGSGTSDLIYLGSDGASVYVNRSGNAFSTALRIRSVPRADALSQLTVVDLLGQGTSCLVWTSSDPGVATPVAYVDLMAGQKPHLLASAVNNLGGETRIDYAPSTKFYLQDKAEGRPWLTRLAFPVHLVERVEHIDHIAGTSLVSRFRYHHGFFDGIEREFHGFARVEQWDAESFTGGLDLPPVRTVTWFHTGAWLERERLERALAQEYYRGDPQAPLLPDTVLPAGMTVREEREAARAMRGQILRQEIYAEDGLPESVHPYSVSERSYEIRVLQHASAAQHAVFFVHPGEIVSLHYERQLDDPRTQHDLVLALDDFGNVTQSAAIGYPRRVPVEPEQGRMWVAVSDMAVANHPDELDWYRIGVAISSQVSELTGLAAPTQGLVAAGALRNAIATAAEIPFETTASGTALQRRTVKLQRTLYYRDDLTGALPLGTIESRALPYESYQHAFTPGLVTAVYGDRVTSTDLTSQGGYLLQDGVWWAPSGRAIHDPAQFYAPVEAIDPFGQHSLMRYDGYALLPLETQDPLGNRTTMGQRDTTGAITQGGNDYRVLAPVLITDPNRNRSAIAFDALGLVIKAAAMGKDGAGEGDTLADPTMRYEYDLHAWQNTGQPVFAHTLSREQHGASNPRWQESYCYTDGTGREVMTKVQAEPGLIPLLDADGHIVRNPDGTPQTHFAAGRWVGTGRTVFDNKGNPVKKYEPFFSGTFGYEDERELVEWGVTPILRYDPLGRLTQTDFPDGSRSRVVYTPWRQEAWDQNDCVSESSWLARMQAGTPAQQRAASLTLLHASTPAVAHTDPLARPFLRIADAGGSDARQTRVALDVQGNTLTSTDPRGIVVAVQTYDLLGRMLHTVMPDSGESRVLADISGQPIRLWSARGFRHRLVYDAIRRPTHVFAMPPDSTAEVLVERKVYGESLPAPSDIASNARGRLVRVFDGAGAIAYTAYDFKGNLLASTRSLAVTYDSTVDWSALATLTDIATLDAAAAPLLSSDAADAFTTSMAYDALDRVTFHTTPDGSVAHSVYNEANLLEQLDVRIRGAATATSFITDLVYDAHGKCTLLARGNATRTAYAYDPQTFRLAAMRTTRDASGFVLQDRANTYDAVGNVVAVADAVAFGNAGISADGLYDYDPLYQLTSATGREHPGQQPAAGDPDLLRLDHPEDLQGLRRYREVYSYDVAGNLTSMAHTPLDGSTGWTRRYSYASDSNRLLATSMPGDAPGTFSATYTHDAHGNMTAMPHLSSLQWDHADQLAGADLGGGGAVHFVYDSAGTRVRKVTVHGGFTEERIYLDGFDFYRKRNASTGAVTLARETLHVTGGDSRIALVETKTIDTSVSAFTPVTRTRYQVSDAHGSSAFELDETAGVITYEEYFAYGGTAFHGAASATDVSAKRYRYTGLERDEETGLDYASARYYSAWLGRWTAADPIALGGGANQFLYCGNNPINRTDPSGTDSFFDWFKPSNWCNPLSSDCQVLPVEVAKGVGKAAYHTGRDTGARVVDMSTMLVSFTGSKTGLWDVGYTEWSPEAKNYDPNKSGWQNIRGSVYNNTVGGIVNTAKGIAEGDPDAIGAGVFALIVAKAGGGSGNPTISVRSPSFALADTAGAFGRVPVLVPAQAVTASVTVPVAQAATAGATLMVAKGGGSGGSGSGKGSKGIVAKQLGGTKPIPTGTGLTLGLGEHLTRFSNALTKAGQRVIDVFQAYDLGYFTAKLNERSYVAAELTKVADVIIQNGGRLKFNLEGLVADKVGITTAELETILKNPTLEAHTDFYVGARQVAGAELQGLLKPWRK